MGHKIHPGSAKGPQSFRISCDGADFLKALLMNSDQSCFSNTGDIMKHGHLLITKHFRNLSPCLLITLSPRQKLG